MLAPQPQCLSQLRKLMLQINTLQFPKLSPKWLFIFRSMTHLIKANTCLFNLLMSTPAPFNFHDIDFGRVQASCFETTAGLHGLQIALSLLFFLSLQGLHRIQT